MRKITLVISAIMQLRIKLSLPYFSRLLELYNKKIKKYIKKAFFSYTILKALKARSMNI